MTIIAKETTALWTGLLALMVLGTSCPCPCEGANLRPLTDRNVARNLQQPADAWDLVQQLYGSNEAYGNAGTSVALSANGSVYAFGNTGFRSGGEVHVIRQADRLGQQQRQILRSINTAPGEANQFGAGLDMSQNGDYIIVGDSGDYSVQVFLFNSEEGSYRALPNAVMQDNEHTGLGGAVLSLYSLMTS